MENYFGLVQLACCVIIYRRTLRIGSKIKLGKFEDALKAYQKVLEIDPQNSIAIDRIALINDNVTSKGTVTATTTTTTTTIANSSGLTGKIILALNLEHSDLLNGTELIQRFVISIGIFRL